MRRTTVAILVIVLLAFAIPAVCTIKNSPSKNNEATNSPNHTATETDNVTEEVEISNNRAQNASPPEVTQALQDNDIQANGKLNIRIDFNRSNTQASNQYAVWIEDMDGNVVKTLFVTNFTSNGGYAMREDSIPTWVAHAKPSDMDKTQIDAITGATPTTGTYSYIWDGTDADGKKVANGNYIFIVEGTLYWSSIVRYEGIVNMGASESSALDVKTVYTEDTEQNRNMLSKLLKQKGKNVRIMPNFHCEYGHNITIGNNVFINFNGIIMDNAEVTIGDDVRIGPNVGVYTVNHAIDPDEKAKGICICKPVHIGNKVWFGADVKILAGVTIGDGSIIGAGSVVTKSIPAGVIAAGNPCKVIRKINENDRIE